MTAEKKKYKASDLTAMIRSKYSGNAYAVLEQVASGTGAGANSWIDAAVFSLWPSQGIWRAACEVKVSRADLLGELSNPAKNEWAREHFDFFWYVVAPGVAKDDEIPTGCGLMSVHGDGLKVVKQAPRREDVKTDKWIIASFARSLDKERDKFIKHGLREAVQADHEYQRAKAWMEGAQKYVELCGEYCLPETSNDVFEKLKKIARDKSPEAKEADHILQVLERFQGHVLEFLLEVAPLASNVLNARDETAKFIVDRFGGVDGKSLDALRRSLNGWDKNTRKRELAARELVASMADPQCTS